jgi:hypothetical protein
MEADHWILLANLAVLLFSVAMNVWMFLSMRSDSRWTAFHTRLNSVETRQSIVETQLKAVPDQDDLQEIREKLGHIDRLVAAQGERNNALLNSVTRIESYLLGGNKR